MLQKINTINSIGDYGRDIGMCVMTLATVVGMLELPSHNVERVVLPVRTVTVTTSNYNDLNNPIRREREETSPEYVSYNENQRTHARSGRY